MHFLALSFLERGGGWGVGGEENAGLLGLYVTF